MGTLGVVSVAATNTITKSKVREAVSSYVTAKAGIQDWSLRQDPHRMQLTSWLTQLPS